MERKRMSVRKIIKETSLTLDRIERESPGMGFLIIKDRMRAFLKQNKRALVAHFEKESPTIESFTYTYIITVSSTALASGEFHIYRGALDQVGTDLLIQFDRANDKLTEMGELDPQGAAHAKDR